MAEDNLSPGAKLILWIKDFTDNLPSDFSATKEELEEINVAYQSDEHPWKAAARILEAREN